ncbi:unnamed protein product [Clavelina lepadiformis]|uniref:dolichyl-phosphate-mannose--protein mannosyltransferase n=1 Tax=Clavelina lepadiformis TaxID=159417 RepID=A0ABP0FY04_CLALP
MLRKYLSDWVAFGLLTVTTWLAYKDVINGPFLHDDIPAIVKNPDVQENSRFSSIIWNDYWGTPLRNNGSHKSYRPVTILFLRMIHSSFDNDPKVYHGVNIFLHAFASYLLMKVCWSLVFDDDGFLCSLLVGLLFSLHPIHTEAVCGVVGCAELLCAVFYLLALLVYPIGSNQYGQGEIITYDKKSATSCNTEAKVERNLNVKASGFSSNNPSLRYRVKRKHDTSMATIEEKYNNESQLRKETKKNHHFPSAATFRMGLSLILVLLAMLSKESGITVLAVLLTIEILTGISRCQHQERKKFWNRPNNRILGKCIVLLFWGILLVLARFWIMDWTRPIFAKPDNPTSVLKNKLTRAMTYSYLVWINMKLLIYPVNLCYDYSYGTIPPIVSISDDRNLLSLCLFLVVLGTIVHLSNNLFRNKETFSKAGAMGYAMMIFPFIPASNLFFPVGFVVAERVLYLPSAGFVICMVHFWHKGLNKFPTKKMWLYLLTFCVLAAYFCLTLRRTNDWTSKENFLRSGLAAAPNNAKIRYNWANFLRENNRLDEAIREYQKTIELYPEYVSAIHNLATILEDDQQTMEEAEKLYALAIRIQPFHENSYRNLANLFVKQNKFDHATKVLLRAIQVIPGEVTHAVGLARIFVTRKQYKQAEKIFQHLLSRPCLTGTKTQACTYEYQMALNDYVELLSKKGDIKTSKKLLGRNMEINSTNAATLIKMSNILMSEGDTYAATQLMLRAIAIDPNQSNNAWQQAADLLQRKRYEDSERLYIAVIEAKPDNLEVQGQFGALLWEKGKRQEAEEFLLNVTFRDLSCEAEAPWRNLAAIQGRERRHKEAIEVLQTCFKRQKKTSKKMPHSKQSVLLCTLAKHQRDRSKQIHAAGKHTTAQTMWKKAIQNLQEAMKLDEKNIEAKQILKQMAQA